MLSILPNLISFLRLPLTFVFLNPDPNLRALALILAMFSDGFDGFLARRYGKISRFGTFLDPFTDKFFVIGVLFIFISEGRLNIWELFAMLSRDFAVFFFGCYLFWKKTLSQYQFRAIWCGKITTTLQFFILLGLIFHVSFPPSLFVCVFILGMGALIELYLDRKKLRVE